MAFENFGISTGHVSRFLIADLKSPGQLIFGYQPIVKPSTLANWTPCSKTCFAGLLIRSIFRGKIERINRTVRHIITHLLNIRTTTKWKMLTNNEFETKTLTENPTGNSRCHVLVSRAFSMSSSFGQSERSLVSRCMAWLRLILYRQFNKN